MLNLNPTRRKEALTLVVVFLLVLLVSAFAVYYLASRSSQSETATQPVQQIERESPPTINPAERRPAAQPERSNDSVFDQVFGTPTHGSDISGESWLEVIAKLSLRLLLAALLGAVLAFRPRRAVIKRNPYVAQTQILLAVVASALMIIVGDNAARAFGIFAAVSVVRFRTNIRDPKEITVLLISLAIGLGTGVGRWDLAVVLTVFALILLWLLEKREPEQVFRAMNVKISTRDVGKTQGVLKQVLEKYNFDSELRVVSGPVEDKPGTLVYSTDVSPTVSTDQLSEEILALDAENVQSIEWEQKKSFSYVYQ